MAAITKTPSNTWKAIIRKRGWPDSKALIPEQRESDPEARLTIRRELGYERETVVCT